MDQKARQSGVESGQPDVLVVGAGFAGMYAIYRLRQAGLSVQVLEAGTDVGGTWYWNRYPGARCDVPSLEYSYGFSDALQQEWDWPEVFSAQPDILAYANHVADRFELRDSIRFNTRITGVHYLETDNVWRLTSERGEVFQAPFCIMATGCLSVPNTPTLPGAENFAGLVLHTGRWPKEPVDLAGLNVGVIGTGSSGVQAIPELAEQSGHLTVFQRTPVYTVPANRKAMRGAIQDEFRANYSRIRQLQQQNPGGVSNYRPGRKSILAAEDHAAESSVVAGGGRRRDDLLALSPERQQQLLEEQGLGALLNFRDVYTQIEANEVANALFRDGIRQQIQDPDVAEKLLPKDYGLGCKRQVLDRDYYATYNRPDVSLIDVRDNPIQEITANGIRTRNQFTTLDVLIYATGFDAMTGALLKADIRGRQGVTLASKWQDGPLAYLGLQMRGFPNLFTVTGPGSPSVLCNMLVAIEQHVDWITECISTLVDDPAVTIEPLAQSEQEWVAQVNHVAEGTMYTSPSCNSWYLGANIPGKPRLFMPYVGGYPRYKERCDAEAEAGYPGFEVSRQQQAQPQEH